MIQNGMIGRNIVVHQIVNNNEHKFLHKNKKIDKKQLM